MDYINGLIETVEGVDEKVFVAAGFYYYWNNIGNRTFITCLLI